VVVAKRLQWVDKETYYISIMKASSNCQFRNILFNRYDYWYYRIIVEDSTGRMYLCADNIAEPNKRRVKAKLLCKRKINSLVNWINEIGDNNG